jgi:hypothetical protein
MASRLRIFTLVFLLVPGFLFADPAPFDLAGPKLEVKVIHAGKTLPISEVPNLSVGDQISIKTDLPPGQSVHYLLVAAFLRGATNPPPENWFFSSETWNSKGSGGLKITVPKDEDDQQSLIAGRDDIVHLETENAACVDSILLIKACRSRRCGNSAQMRQKSYLPTTKATHIPVKIYASSSRPLSQFK